MAAQPPSFSLDTLSTLSQGPERVLEGVAYIIKSEAFFSQTLTDIYSPIRSLIMKAYMDGDKEQLQALLSRFVESARLLPQREGMLIAEKNAAIPDETQIQETGRALGEIQTQVAGIQRARIQKNKQSFIHTLVENYSKNQPTNFEEQISDIISESERKQKSSSGTSISQVVYETITEKGSRLTNRNRIARDIERFIQKTHTENEAFQKEIGSSLFSSPEPKKTAAVIIDVLSSPKGDNLPINEVAAYANGVTAGAIALSQNEGVRKHIASYTGNNFFSAISQTVSQKSVWAPLTDIATTILGRDKVLEYLYEQTVKDIAKRFGKTFSSSQSKVDSIATAVFSSEAFRGLITETQRHIADSSGGGSPSLLSPARGFVDSVIRPIFQKPLEESVIAYMHAIYIDKVSVSVALQQYYLMMPLATPQSNGGGILSWIFHLGKDKAADMAADAAMKKAAGTTVSGVVKAGVTATAMTIFGWSPPGWLAAAIGWVGSKILFPVAKFILGGIGNILNGGPLRLLMMGGIETEEGKRELLQLTLFAGLPILVIIILFMLPTPLNVNYMNTLQNNLAFINTGIDGLDENGMGTGELSDEIPEGQHTPLIDCQIHPENPLCHLTDCSNPVLAADGKIWPTTGTITQGPYTTCGDTSHRNLNAIDIGAQSGTSVYATTVGTIVNINSNCIDNVQGNCGGGYGNYVVVQSDSGYTLTFGHLMQSSLSSLQVGARVTSTSSIGRVDHNGYSTGPHLHFGYKGSGSINDILPENVPSCANGTGGCGSCGYRVVSCAD